MNEIKKLHLKQKAMALLGISGALAISVFREIFLTAPLLGSIGIVAGTAAAIYGYHKFDQHLQSKILVKDKEIDGMIENIGNATTHLKQVTDEHIYEAYLLGNDLSKQHLGTPFKINEQVIEEIKTNVLKRKATSEHEEARKVIASSDPIKEVLYLSEEDQTLLSKPVKMKRIQRNNLFRPKDKGDRA